MHILISLILFVFAMMHDAIPEPYTIHPKKLCRSVWFWCFELFPLFLMVSFMLIYKTITKVIITSSNESKYDQLLAERRLTVMRKLKRVLFLFSVNYGIIILINILQV